MHLRDVISFGIRASFGYPARTLLMLLAMAISVGSVVILSSLGEGARQYVLGQFSSLGTNLIIILPGRSETVGGPPPLLGVTPRDLTLEDALALTRSSAIRHVAPIVVGAAPVSAGVRERETSVLGSTPALFPIRQLEMARGRFLPEGDPSRAAAVCVLGYEIKTELFGTSPAVGETVRIGDRRFRVIGVLADKGESVGMDMGDIVIVPVAAAQALFNTSSLFRIMVEASGRDAIERAKTTIAAIIRERHDGEDDITIITQDAILATFDKIFVALTLTVAGIAAISLAVAGILIMNVMLIAVSQRRSEVGLLKAIGAPGGRIMALFLAESAILSLIGAAQGLILAAAGTWLIGRIFPDFPLSMPLWALAAAVGVALTTGLVFGVLPARRAARLDPVQSLSRR
ncbi:MAG: FtsX-like permease family protein [Desulfobulbaceae bacterium]|nr:MAG: FtsX-like permease family protein [Desulfobulbaceae bacterium]